MKAIEIIIPSIAYTMLFYRCYILSYDVGRKYGCGYTLNWAETNWIKNKKLFAFYAVFFSLTIVLHILYLFFKGPIDALRYLFPFLTVLLSSGIFFLRWQQGKYHKKFGISSRLKEKELSREQKEKSSSKLAGTI